MMQTYELPAGLTIEVSDNMSRIPVVYAFQKYVNLISYVATYDDIVIDMDKPITI